MTKGKRIEQLELMVRHMGDTIDYLNFIVENGKDKTRVDIQSRPLGSSVCAVEGRPKRYTITFTFVDQMLQLVKKEEWYHTSVKEPVVTILEEDHRQAILKINDMWFKLDKPKATLIDIPEPAGYTTYVRDELTKDDKLEPSDMIMEELLVKKTLTDATDPVHTCANCKHLKVINDNDIYAVCKRTHFVFEPFEIDTRTTRCRWGECKYDPYSNDECCGDTEGKDEVKSDDYKACN